MMWLKNLKEKVVKSLARDVITTDGVRKFTRKTREYKLTYALLMYLADEKEASAGNNDIENITKLFKNHRSAMDADFIFIANC